jgi:acyl-CoA hydrolase
VSAAALGDSRLRDLYAAKRLAGAELRARLADVESLATGLMTGQARTVLRALTPRDPARPLVVYAGILADAYDFLRDPAVRVVSGFFGPIERMARAAGLAVEFFPADFHGFERLTLGALRPRAVAALMSAPDAEGFCTFGLHAGAVARPFVEAARDPTRLAIAEVNADVPRVAGLPEFGGNRVHLSEIDVVVEDTTPLVTVPYAEPVAEERAIAGFVAELVDAGATLQFGIGGIPNAVAELLCAAPKGDYGIHTEMMVDGIMRLHQAGKVVNRKGHLDGWSLCTFAGGGAELYRWLDGNPVVRMLPVGVTNDPARMALNRRFTSINAALAVDLRGQIVADGIGGRQYSGIGGHETFTMGARQAPDGKSIICLRSTATVAGARRSTIVAELPAGAIVTTPRHQVDYVVTEWGIAHVGVLGDGARAAALAAIAHPDFRADLVR